MLYYIEVYLFLNVFYTVDIVIIYVLIFYIVDNS